MPIINALRAIPFWSAMVVVGAVMLFIPTYAPMGVVFLLTGVFGWRQKFNIYRKLRRRLKTQGTFHAESYNSYYHTWCERMALYQAARENDFYEAAYHHGRYVLGYRLWHIVPR